MWKNLQFGGLFLGAGIDGFFESFFPIGFVDPFGAEARNNDFDTHILVGWELGPKVFEIFDGLFWLMEVQGLNVVYSIETVLPWKC